EREAKKLEAERDRHRSRDPYFDYAEVFLQIAIVTASVSILATSRLMFGFSLVLAVVGVLYSIDGFTLALHLPLLHGPRCPRPTGIQPGRATRGAGGRPIQLWSSRSSASARRGWLARPPSRSSCRHGPG